MKIEELRTGDILHCRRNTLTAKLIRLFTGGWPSHTATVVECWGQTYVIDAQSDGISPKPIKQWLKKYKYEVIVARPDYTVDSRGYSIRAFSKSGITGYAYASLIFVHPWMALTGSFPHSDPEKDKMVCSEYVAWLNGIKFPYRMTPNDMMNYTKQNNFIHHNLEKKTRKFWIFKNK